MSRVTIFFWFRLLKVTFIPEAAAATQAAEAAEVAAATAEAEALEVTAAVSSYKCQLSSYNTGRLFPVSV